MSFSILDGFYIALFTVAGASGVAGAPGTQIPLLAMLTFAIRLIDQLIISCEKIGIDRCSIKIPHKHTGFLMNKSQTIQGLTKAAIRDH